MIDGHIHIWKKDIDPAAFVGNLKKCNVDGGIIFSRPPASFEKTYEGISWKDRIDGLMRFTEDYDCLYPFYFIDPTEDDVYDQIDYAAERKVKGFKAICTHYYPQDDNNLRVWQYIADKEKPVIFHSGILYNDRPSAQYNHPGCFEALFYIKNLRFSLAHVGWPWVDEMIAVFGKWEFFYKKNGQNDMAEMYIDLAPGTPPIYRRDTLGKLFSVGYSMMKRRVYWGTDDNINYNIRKSEDIYRSDKEILQDFLSEKEQKDIMHNNVLSFIEG